MKILLLVLSASAVFLAGCENDAASYQIEGKDHSISLTREQRWFWSSEVEQRLVVARFPVCQRRFEVVPGTTASVKVELYGVGPRMFVAHQGNSWYALSTETCELQKFKEPPEAYGQLMGAFQKKDDKLVFVATPGGAAVQDALPASR